MASMPGIRAHSLSVVLGRTRHHCTTAFTVVLASNMLLRNVHANLCSLYEASLVNKTAAKCLTIFFEQNHAKEFQILYLTSIKA